MMRARLPPTTGALVYRGEDPVVQRRLQRMAAASITFEAAARIVYEQRRAGWNNGKHVDQWISSLEDYAFPHIGAIQVHTIDTPHVLKVLTPIWLSKQETARRIRQRISVILDWARAAVTAAATIQSISLVMRCHASAKVTFITQLCRMPRCPHL